MMLPAGDDGFSLVEILVAIALMAIMTVAVAPQLKYLIGFQSAADTRNRLSELQSGFAAAYLANIGSIEADPGAEINFGVSGIMAPATAAAGARCSAASGNFVAWSDYSGHAAASLVDDGYGAPLCIFINPQASMQSNGVTLYYHTVAFVSTGPNNVLDTGTGLNANGSLLLAGDDSGVLFDGRAFANSNFIVTAGKMRTIVQALETYYLARYQADPTRSSSIDYWSDGTGSPDPARWDSTNPGNLIGWLPVAAPMFTGSSTDLASALSLSRDDVTDGYGNVIRFENAGNDVRSPDNGVDVNMTTPPYTALVSTTLPGNVAYAQAAVGVNN